MKKLANVVMLSTEKATKIILNKSTNKLIFIDKKVIPHNNVHGGQELYFTTDEEINEGDWCIYKDKYIVQIKETDPSGYICSDNCKPLFHEVKKIVASTDESLEIVSKGINPVYEKLPRPSNEFLKAYCEAYNSNPITEVNIEYVKLPVWHNRCPNGGTMITEIVGHTNTIKVAPDNTITISKVEEKVYTREELTKLVKSAWYTGRDRGKYKEDLQPSHENEVIAKWLKDKLK